MAQAETGTVSLHLAQPPRVVQDLLLLDSQTQKFPCSWRRPGPQGRDGRREPPGNPGPSVWTGRCLPDLPREERCPLVLMLTCPLRAPLGKSSLAAGLRISPASGASAQGIAHRWRSRRARRDPRVGAPTGPTLCGVSGPDGRPPAQPESGRPRSLFTCKRDHPDHPAHAPFLLRRTAVTQEPGRSPAGDLGLTGTPPPSLPVGQKTRGGPDRPVNVIHFQELTVRATPAPSVPGVSPWPNHSGLAV